MIVQRHDISHSSYRDIWDFQTLLHERLKDQKVLQSRNSPKPSTINKVLNHIIFCEHNDVITLGKSAKDYNLLSDKKQLSDEGIELYKINRGGDITYHGPGQLTGYLILDLELLYRDVHRYVRNIEQSIIDLLKLYDITGVRHEEYTGVWVNDKSSYRKVCAIGVHLSRWVSMHGFGLNINTNLEKFNHIIPCGISDNHMKVTSLAEELGEEQSIDVIKNQLQQILKDVFNLQYV